MNPNDSERTIWQAADVTSPHIPHPVSVIVARDVPYIPHGHRFQTFSIYIPKTPENESLVNKPATALPLPSSGGALPSYHVHIHGGAWRDPLLTSRSVEATVAHAFSTGSGPIAAIIGINYTISPFPTHPSAPYDPWKDNDPVNIKIPESQRDFAREARHPMHIRDALSAFQALRVFGLKDDNFILSGHSCGACISFQAVLQPPAYWNLQELPGPPRPAALIGLNGLYDLPALVYNLGPSHEHLCDDYQRFQRIAFGDLEKAWPVYSPALFNAANLQKRLRDPRHNVPKIILLDQSTEDQLVPMNQMEQMREKLNKVGGVEIITGNRCFGTHAGPWEEGYMIWDTVRDVLELLNKPR